GDIDSAKYELERDKIRRELSSLETPESVKIEEAAALLEDFPEIWKQASLIERKKLLQEIFDKIVVKDRQIVEVLPRPPFVPFFSNFPQITKTVS
ncbi:MAG: hypothetical protein JSV36_16770, partial [Anaerolineae bacterium]